MSSMVGILHHGLYPPCLTTSPLLQMLQNIYRLLGMLTSDSPEVGPLVGGFINYFTNWRWSFYVLMIWAGVQLVLIFLLVPETYHPVILKQKAKSKRKETGNNKWRAPIEVIDKSILRTVMLSCKRPFQLLFFEPMVRILPI
jgi:MFS family permease